MGLIKAKNRMIDGSIVSVKDYGAVGDGAQNCSDAFTLANAAGSHIVVPEGVYLITSNLTINKPIWFMGGKIKVANGVTVTINAPINAQIEHIFDIALGGVVKGDFKVDAVYPEWWGAYSDNTNGTATRKAIQAAIDASLSSTGLPDVLFTGSIYLIDDTLTKPGTKVPNLRGMTRHVTQIRYAFGADKPALRIYGGAAYDTGSVIENLSFKGDSQSTAIEVISVCMMKIVNCVFYDNAKGILFHNSGAGSFTEYTVAENCNFAHTCLQAAVYKITGGNNSFHGSGLKGCQIVNAVGNALPAIEVQDACVVYNAPMDFQIWTNTATQTVISVGGSNARLFVTGDITVEAFTAPAAISGGTSAYQFLAGNVMSWGAAVKLGKLHLCDEFGILSNGTIRAIMKDSHNSVTLPAGGGSITLGQGNVANGEFLVTVELTGANYVYKYQLYCWLDGFSAYGVNIINNTRAFNSSGWGAPTFTYSNNTLTIANANYPADAVVASLNIKHMGQANYNWARN